MIEYPMNIILQWLADFLLPLTRISAMLGVMAGIGSRTTPLRIKSALAVLLTIMVMPVLPPSAFTDLFSFQMVLMVAQQMLIGVIIGFVSMLMLNTFVLAGQIVAMQTGLGFASMVDPVNGMNVPAVGQFYLILATLLFWALDGHLVLIQMVVHSFIALPVSYQWLDISHYYDLANWGGWMFSTAMVLALPPMTAMLLINITFGILTRAAPQLNVFTIGFPITMTSGLLIMWITLENFAFHFDNQWQQALLLACGIVGC
ncbi:MAG: flagellar biosynthetic protein FliR [Alteromonadaceae bacterium]|jgi:flagellar biosynthetic protein FliR